VETIGKIRRWDKVEHKSISEIARRLGASRNTVKKYLRSEDTRPVYKKRAKRLLALGCFASQLDAWLLDDSGKLARERRTGRRLFEGLQALGYTGSYASVQRHARSWRQAHGSGPVRVFIPLVFAPGEAYQFDWSHETVELAGVPTPVKVAHLRLCYSRVFFVTAYLREAQEMVFDAHWRAFSAWNGVPKRGIYDNLKTAVDLVFIGKQRQYNRRFLQMCSHYLIDPVACTPAAGWEKGQVENQVGNVREWFFVPRPQFKTLADLNTWLAARSLAHAKTHAHPEQPDKTLLRYRRGQVFEGVERPALIPLVSMFEGFTEKECRVSSTALVHYDRNRYSVQCQYAGKTVAVRAYAERIAMVADGKVVGEHVRSFGRGRTVFDPWHYVPALERKPGALRNGAPFRGWNLPTPVAELRDQLLRKPGGDREFVSILNAIVSDGLEAVTVACELALEANAASADYVLNVLSRFRPQPPPIAIVAPEQLRLKEAPQANMARDDELLEKLACAVLVLAPVVVHVPLEVVHAAA
jgi:transposase